jgi:hypothetical protein
MQVRRTVTIFLGGIAFDLMPMVASWDMAFADACEISALGNLAFVALVVTVILAALRWSYRRALHDYASGTRVVTAGRRKIVLREDVRMMIPGRVDLTKRI